MNTVNYNISYNKFYIFLTLKNITPIYLFRFSLRKNFLEHFSLDATTTYNRFMEISSINKQILNVINDIGYDAYIPNIFDGISMFISIIYNAFDLSNIRTGYINNHCINVYNTYTLYFNISNQNNINAFINYRNLSMPNFLTKLEKNKIITEIESNYNNYGYKNIQSFINKLYIRFN